MRIFLGGTVAEQLRWVVGEMINLETQCKFYELGELVAGATRAAYPVFRQDLPGGVRGRTVTIRAAEGMIMLPSVTKDLYTQLDQQLTVMYQEAGFTDSIEVFRRRRVLSAHSRHFTSLSAQLSYPAAPPEISSPNQTTPDGKALHQYRAYVPMSGFDSGTEAAFVWYLAGGYEEWITVLGHTHAEVIHPIVQTTSIMVDGGNWTTGLAHGGQIMRLITWRDLMAGSRIREVGTWGPPQAVMRVLETSEDLGDDPRKNARLQTEWRQFRTHPGYFMGYTCGAHVIRLCVIRGAIFEIARHLAKPSMFEPTVLTIDSMMSASIYDIDASQITWNPELGTTSACAHMEPHHLEPQDRCHRCRMPLYGEYYVLFDTLDTNVGTPYCRVCPHLRYTPEGEIDPRGQSLWRSKILGRTRHTRTLDEVLSWLPNQDPVYLDILRAAESRTFKILQYRLPDSDKVVCTLLGNDEWAGLYKHNMIQYLEHAMEWRMPLRSTFPCDLVGLTPTK
jgi:hypothetical protein